MGDEQERDDHRDDDEMGLELTAAHSRWRPELDLGHYIDHWSRMSLTSDVVIADDWFELRCWDELRPGQ